jgi:hypothetical protein
MYRNWVALLKANWNEALTEKNFAISYVLNFTACFILYIVFSRFLIYNRFHPGAVLADPLFSISKSIDFNLPIFAMTYVGIFSFLFYIIPRPREFMFGVRGFLALFIIRVSFIYLVPLRPPIDMIPLHDPFIDRVVGFNGEVVNDLFFSGHVADLFFFAFCCTDRIIRNVLYFAGILVGIMVIGQKVHYTADVLAAPFFSYGCVVVFLSKRRL